MNTLRRLLEWLLGMDQLRDDNALYLGQSIDHKAVRTQLEAKVRKLEGRLETAHQVHLRDEASIAEVAGQRWSAVAALMGGVEQLQHKWQDENPPRHGRVAGSGSIAAKVTAAHVNELGGLKRSIQRQFGMHPSQAPKSAADVLGYEPFGSITQKPASPEKS